jgi:hypothetical protein
MYAVPHSEPIGRCTAHRHSIVRGGHAVYPEGTISTATGFVAESDYDTIDGGARLHYRSVSLVTIQDGQISNVIHNCTGPWDEATRARQTREPPMLRPDA